MWLVAQYTIGLEEVDAHVLLLALGSFLVEEASVAIAMLEPGDLASLRPILSLLCRGGC